MSDPITGQGALPNAQNDVSLMEFIARQVVNGLATTTLVLVKAVHAETVDVQPMPHQIDGAGTANPHGVIHDLPFFKLRAGAVEIRAIPVVGDIGIAVFCHSDVSSVKATKAPAPPPTRRRFDWSDGVYLGGILGPTATAWIDVTPTVIEVTAPTIKLNGAVEITGDLTHNGNTTQTGNITQTGDMSSSGTITGTTDVVGGGKHLKTHTHGGVQTGSGTSGPPS